MRHSVASPDVSHSAGDSKGSKGGAGSGSGKSGVVRSDGGKNSDGYQADVERASTSITDGVRYERDYVEFLLYGFGLYLFHEYGMFLQKILHGRELIHGTILYSRGLLKRSPHCCLHRNKL